MTTTASNSVSHPPAPEFDAVVLGRSFASQRVSARLRDELRLAVHEIGTASAVRYDDIDHRWEILIGGTVVGRAKFVVDGHGGLTLQGRDGAALERDALTVHGFPNLFRPIVGTRTDPVGYTVSCIEYMRSNGLDYVERRLRTPVADDDFPELSFDRPTPILWFG
ncbi:hypothetical protein [Rhodococcus rhodochrous]|uniref:AraC family transcriptional regulator n=1 Tax=Rhodococcus rhodochrous TaxID=1829 RepID=A0AAW4XLC1_RHORH|nr:hypothetical protein [Rhodococcus rhodochrous]KLL96737.1 hypothetical protein NJ76_04515 [Rhodococcus sp. IITR03]MCR8694639.1 hypothetical protein [Rhodococcus pyridinivorans]MCD2113589.1 hypothetical protein [Rhodococcus rhodochrous]QHG81732.1 hypothetical protein D1O33_07140 [Rhodococcus rhodochrous]QOH58592.1 hypothetical protein C6Y44_23390 [Rhodococcus rhodochrous]